MPAYKYPSDWDEGEEIRFYATLDDADPEEGEPEPTPEFDQYEALGYVPTEALIANGWYLYCDHCSRRSDCEEDDDHEGQRVEHVFRGQLYFCHPDCERSWQAERDRAKADQAKFREYLEGKYPGLTLGAIFGGDKYGLYVSCKFPGGSGSFSQAAADEKIYLSTAAVEAWAAFAADCKSKPKAMPD
jgi:hypothetical protein